MDNEENEIVQEDLDPEQKQASYGAGDSDLVEEYQGDEIKKLKGKLKEAEGKAKEYLDGWQRSQADFANLRKRDEEAKVEFIKFASLSLVEELIPVLDTFNFALASGNKVLEPVYKQFWQILKARGLEESDPVGETFDPRFHDAISMVPTEKEDEDHKVLEVLQKGYILSGKVIRPAKVRIGEYKN